MAGTALASYGEATTLAGPGVAMVTVLAMHAPIKLPILWLALLWPHRDINSQMAGPGLKLIEGLAVRVPEEVCFGVPTLAPAPHLAFVCKDDGVLSTTGDLQIATDYIASGRLHCSRYRQA